MTRKLKILIVEDNQSDEDLLLRELRKFDLDFISKTVQTRQNYEIALVDFNPDLILSDFALPTFDAVTAFTIKQVNHAQIPFIIVSGFIGEENAIELIKTGVTDYVSKERLYTLNTKIKRALGDSDTLKEKKITDEKLALQSAELFTLNQQLEIRVTNRTKALAESESLFRNMMETIPQIAWTNTVKGNVVFYNKRWYDYTGLNKEQTDLTGLSATVHPDDLKESEEKYRTIISGTEGGEFQIRAKRNDGTYRWHLIRLMPIVDEQGLIKLWIGTATDIQELRVLQQQKDDFISIASHELKTPITSLKAYLQLLDRIKDKPTASLPRLVTSANKSLEKVNLLIEDLLNTGMATEGQLNINPKHFILAEMIEESCHNVQNEGIYHITIAGDLTLAVNADAIRIEQVVTNFVNNAIKYAAKSFSINIKIESIEQAAKISIMDNGPGIAPEKLPYLFDRYYRVNTRETRYNGLGLGLYICAEIIKKHNGTIGVDSELGVGTSFWFTLPLV